MTQNNEESNSEFLDHEKSRESHIAKGRGEDTLKFYQLFQHFRSYFDVFKPPTTIGVYGDWGSGKTTFLDNFQETYKDEFHFVTFDAWKYKTDKHLFYALIDTILQEIKKLKKDDTIALKEISEIKERIVYSKEKPKYEGVLNYFSSALLFSILAFLILCLIIANLVFWKDSSFSLGNFFTIILAFIMGIVSWAMYLRDQSTAKLTKGPAENLDEIQKDLSSLLQGINHKKFIIIIENIDRCIPEKGIRLIENLKSF